MANQRNCAPPNAFDREYTRNLGFGAVRYLAAGNSGALITFDGGKLKPMSFDELQDPETKKTKVRMVDVESEGFLVALSYMIRFKEEDLENMALMTKMQRLGGYTEQQFHGRFSYLVK